MERSWLEPNNLVNRWIATDDVSYYRDTTGDWVPNYLTPLRINNNFETEISIDMNDAWLKAYNDIVDQFKKEDDKMTTNKTNHYCYPVIEKVIVNGPATIVYFDDNDRVIVKKMGVDKDDLFSAVAQAYCKKAFGSTSAFHREVLNKLVVQEPKKKNASVSPEINKQIDDGIRSVAEGINSAFKQMIDNFKPNI